MFEGNNVKVIGDFAFCYTAVESMELKEGIATVGAYAFDSCSNLSRLVWPTSITAAGEKIFDGCAKLHELAGSSSQDAVITYLKSKSTPAPTNPPASPSSTSSPLVPEGVRACEHFFDMRGAGGDVTDRCSSLMARLQGGARRTQEGLVLDGKDGSYAKLDPWPFGGPTSIEVYVRYANFDTHCARVFSFCQNNADDAVQVCNVDDCGKAQIAWGVKQGSNYRNLVRESTCFDLAWVHIVLTACGSTMCTYKDGELAETTTDGHEPKTLTRDYHCIGSWGGRGNFLNGTVAFLRMWDVALKADEVQKLYASRDSHN